MLKVGNNMIFFLVWRASTKVDPAYKAYKDIDLLGVFTAVSGKVCFNLLYSGYSVQRRRCLQDEMLSSV